MAADDLATEFTDLVDNIGRRVRDPTHIPDLPAVLDEISALPTHAGADPGPQMAALLPRLLAVKTWMDDATAADLAEIERNERAGVNVPMRAEGDVTARDAARELARRRRA